MMKHFLQHFFIQNQIFDYAVIYSETASISGDFDFMPKKSIMTDFSETSINKIIDYQINQLKQKKTKQCLIVLDDTISAMGHDFMQIINKLYSKGRHWKISVCLITQYVKQCVSTVVRSNIDYLLFSKNTVPVLTFLYEMVVFNGSVKEFISWVQKNTDGFQFILYDTLHDCQFYFIKAPADLELKTVKFKNTKHK